MGFTRIYLEARLEKGAYAPFCCMKYPAFKVPN